jgi:hypothetical protein
MLSTLIAAVSLIGSEASSAPACAPMELRRGRPFVEIAVNGRAVSALVDSAAEATIIDAGFARTLGLERKAEATARGSGGETEAHLLESVDVSVAGRKIADVHPFAIDLSEVNARLLKERVVVILGRELFEAERTTLDYPGRRLCLIGRETPPKGVELRLENERGLANMPIEIEGRKARADIDTGNSGALLLGRGFVDGAGFLTDGRKIGVNKGGGIGGEITRKRFFVRSVTIAGETFKGAPAVVDPLPNAGPANVGSGLLKYFRVTLDFRDGIAWFER